LQIIYEQKLTTLDFLDRQQMARCGLVSDLLFAAHFVPSN